MEYMMISMLTIAIFTYVVYLLANKLLAIRMHIKFLVLCAFCAFAMSLILPRLFVGIVGLSGTFCIIILFGLISSYFIARYYDADLQKTALKNTLLPISMEVPEIAEPDEEDFLPTILSFKTVHELAENLQIATGSITKESFDPTVLAKSNEDQEPENLSAEVEETEIEIKEYLYPIKCKEEFVLSSIEDLVEHHQEDSFEEEAEFPKELIPLKTEEEMEVTMEEAEIEDQEVSLADENPIMEPPDPEVISEEIIDPELDPSSTDLDVLNESITFENQEVSLADENPIMELPDPEVISEEIIDPELDLSSTDLDILMDLAFLQKEQKKFSQALITFRRALSLYPNSEVSPFLVIEIGNILKNTGLYNEAIQVFTEGRLLSGVMDNDSLEHEFINNIAYLRVVKNILIKNSLEFAPLNQLSSDILKEIDDEFSDWRSQS